MIKREMEETFQGQLPLSPRGSFRQMGAESSGSHLGSVAEGARQWRRGWLLLSLRAFPRCSQQQGVQVPTLQHSRTADLRVNVCSSRPTESGFMGLAMWRARGCP